MLFYRLSDSYNSSRLQSLLSQYSLKPEQCLFIDDTLANVEGAKAVGIEALHCTDHDQLAQDLIRLGVCPKYEDLELN